MNRKRQLLAIGVCVVTVIASGKYMELGQHPSAPEQASSAPAFAPATKIYGLKKVTPLAARASNDPVAVPTRAALPDLPKDPEVAVVLPAATVPTEIRAMPRSEPMLAALLSEGERFGASGLPCGPSLEAAPAVQGMARLSISAPCQPDSLVTVTHDMMSFTVATDPMGLASVTVPAFADVAVFLAEFPDGTTMSRAVAVPEAADITRVALQTQGASGMLLHAYEDGASYGDPGHVWAGAPRGNGARGSMTQLGDPMFDGGRSVQVYSAPADLHALRLSVEVEVNAANCGRDVEAETLFPDADGQTLTRRLVLDVPDCDALGEFLVLKNLPQDRTLAGK
ncbi:MAG: hypothetical protein JXJ18_11665 [Rhodobacteraceae bacterium]|nr:hypothetical protein [Paracoccaceae bacterium]